MSPNRAMQSTNTSTTTDKDVPTEQTAAKKHATSSEKCKSAALSPPGTSMSTNNNVKHNSGNTIPLGRHNTITASDNIELCVAKDRLKKKVLKYS